jgi:hypothetical protein
VSEKREPEDSAVFGVLHELARPGGGTSPEDTVVVLPPGDDPEGEVLGRLYLETAGLLAYELEPRAPSLDLRARLLASIAGDETQEVTPLTSPSPMGKPVPAPPASAAPVASAAPPTIKRAPDPATAAKSAPDPRPAPPAEAPRPPREQRAAPRRASRWPWALAALFALAAIGLGVWTAQLDSELDYRDAKIRQLESDLAGSSKLSEELAAARAEVARLEQRYAFVTAPATTVFALRPPAEGALQPLARGHLFVSSNRRDWRLQVRGLTPEGEAQDYQLWFIVDGVPRSGGVFDARLGAVAELSAGAMPTGTSVVAITLEKKGGSPAPTAAILLVADSSVRI